MYTDKTIIILTLKNLPVLINDYLIQIPQKDIDIKRNKDTWTIREHFYHIVSVQQMLYERILKIRNDINPFIQPYFPTEEENIRNRFNSHDEAFTKYNEFRSKQISVVDQLTPEEFTRKAEHPQYKEYSMLILLNHMIFHEYWHMYRIEEIWLTKDEFFS
jgi:hypothetical protein